MVSSDGGIGMRHPRGTGTFPRVLGRYVRERGWLTLEVAVHKMTALPASRLALRDRGLLKKGLKADVIIFDPQLVIDRSTMLEPFLEPVGVETVVINGQVVILNGESMGVRPGKVVGPVK
jgi:N-acyl-D-aspartate/D-glutamate deacylase